MRMRPTSMSMIKDLNPDQRHIIQEYNVWIRKMDPDLRKWIEHELYSCKTFKSLRNIMRKFNDMY